MEIETQRLKEIAYSSLQVTSKRDCSHSVDAALVGFMLVSELGGFSLYLVKYVKGTGHLVGIFRQPHVYGLG